MRAYNKTKLRGSEEHKPLFVIYKTKRDSGNFILCRANEKRLELSIRAGQVKVVDFAVPIY